MNIDVTATTRTKPGETETRRNMAKRTSLLGRSRPSERLTREEITALDKATVPEPPAKPPWNEWWWSAADGAQRPAHVSLEPRVPGLRFQGHRQWPAPARATPGEVRPLQIGPRPGRRAKVPSNRNGNSGSRFVNWPETRERIGIEPRGQSFSPGRLNHAAEPGGRHPAGPHEPQTGRSGEDRVGLGRCSGVGRHQHSSRG